LNPITLLIWVVVFAIAFGIVSWTVEAGRPRNIFYAILGVIAVLFLLGMLTGYPFIRVH